MQLDLSTLALIRGSAFAACSLAGFLWLRFRGAGMLASACVLPGSTAQTGRRPRHSDSFVPTSCLLAQVGKH